MKQISILMIAVATALSGCSLAPKYERPNLPVIDRFPGTDAEAIENMKVMSWKEYFNDPRLNKLIELTLENNRDLRIAALNIQISRDQYGIAQGVRLPSVAASGGAKRSGSLLESLDGIPKENREQFGHSQTYSFGYGISSYELDFFGRLKSLSDAAFNKYLATEEGRKSAQIAMISQVAQLYVNERLSLEQLDVAKSTLNANQASYNLIKQQVDAGIASDLDLKQSETQVLSARIAVSVYERQSLQAKNALIQMVGIDAQDLPAGLMLSQMKFGKNLPVGLPSEVMLNRPDIIAAERNLIAANANIGAARAAFFPRISLSATIGYAYPAVSGLINSKNGRWNTDISGTLPIFTWGQNKNNLNIAEVSKDISVATYEKAIQTAFKEVSDALVAKKPLASQVKSQIDLAAAEQERLNLSQLLYNNGVASFLDVLDAQRTLFSARQGVLTARTTEIVNSISLFTALGGGYDEPEVDLNPKVKTVALPQEQSKSKSNR